MISERENISATYTAEGSSEAQKIRNTTDKEVNVLLSEANKMRRFSLPRGEAEYMRILSEAYSDESKQDFYSFVRSLDALKASMTGDNKTVIPCLRIPRSRRFSTEDNIKAGVCNILAGTGFFMPESPQFCVSLLH